MDKVNARLAKPPFNVIVNFIVKAALSVYMLLHTGSILLTEAEWRIYASVS